jgi:hypothetical protein
LRLLFWRPPPTHRSRTIWLPTIKKQELPWFPCMQVACHISLKSYRWGLQLCFKLHLNWNFTHKFMGPQSWDSPKVVGVPILGILGLPLGIPGTKWHLGAGPVARHRVYYKGEGGGFPQVWAMVSLVSLCLLVAFSAPKCSNYALTNLLFGLCKTVWVIELLVNLPNPISKLQHAPLPPKCYKLGSTSQLLLLPLFSPLDSQLSPSRNWGCVSNVGICFITINKCFWLFLLWLHAIAKTHLLVEIIWWKNGLLWIVT